MENLSEKLFLIVVSATSSALIALFLYNIRKRDEHEKATRSEGREFIKERRAKKRKRHNLLRIYSDLLSTSINAMLHRLNEIIKNSGRAEYLKSNKNLDNFSKYKYISTLYRFGSVLGWIRAYRRERSYLNPFKYDLESEDSWETLVSSFESSLADGPHVEEIRLGRIIDLYDQPEFNQLKDDKELRRNIAIDLDNHLRQQLQSKGKQLAMELSPEEKEGLTKSINEIIERHLNKELRTRNEPSFYEVYCNLISIKQGWIYRDWQAGIGDMMIEVETNIPLRKFSVIGFMKFEELYLQSENSGTDVDPNDKWIQRLAALFAGLEFSGDSDSDARIDQIKNIKNCLEKMKEHLESIRSNLLSLE